MGSNTLSYFDAVIAVSGDAINRGFQRLFDEDQLHDEFKFDVGAKKYGKKFKAQIGLPRLAFIPDQSHLARITVDIPTGKYLAGKIWNEEEQKPEEISYDLKGSSLSFNVDLKKVEYEHFHDRNFLVEEIYLEFTKIRNIDTQAFAVDLGDLEEVGNIVNGLVQALTTKATWTANDPTANVETEIKGSKKGGAVLHHTGDRLFLGRVTVPKVEDTKGPFRPTSATHSVTIGKNGEKVAGELNFLMMMNHRSQPTDKRAGIYNELWGGGGPNAPDATLVLSDLLMLEGIGLPLANKCYEKAEFELTRGDEMNPSKLTLKKVVTLIANNKEVQLTKCDVHFNDKGQIQFDTKLERSERLQTDDEKVDFALVEVMLRQTHTICFSLKLTDDGDLTLDLEKDEKGEVTPEIKGNFEVKKAADITKYVMGAFVLVAGPFAPAIAAITGISMGLAITIQGAVVDKDILDDFQNRFMSTIDGMNLAIEMPGHPVFHFTNPRMQGRALVVDANYVPQPKLRDPMAKPFQIPEFKRMTKLGQLEKIPAETEPVLIGETALSFRFVEDKLFDGHQAKEMPYYILSREQFWKRQHYKEFSGRKKEDDNIEFAVTTTKETNEEMEQTINMELSVEGGLTFGDWFTSELRASISKELRTQTSVRNEIEKEEKWTKKIEYEAGGKPFAEAVWSLVDRYTLRRNERERSEVSHWDFVHKDYVVEDVYPHKAPSA